MSGLKQLGVRELTYKLAFLVSSASAEIDDDFGFLLCYLVAR